MSYPHKPSALLVPLLAIALLTSLIATTAVSAAPKDIGGPDGNPDTEQHDPPKVTQPQPPRGDETTTIQTTLPNTTDAVITKFRVTTDSVSALAEISYEDTRRVIVDWGDGTTERVEIKPNRPADHPLPANTVFLQHTYDDNGGEPYLYIATVQAVPTDLSGGIDRLSWLTQIEPRYFVTQTGTKFVDSCDTSLQNTNSYEISRSSSFEGLDNQWDIDLEPSKDPQTANLGSASFYQEFTKEEASDITYRVIEKNAASENSEESRRYRVEPGMKTGGYVFHYKTEDLPETDCLAELRFNIGSGLVQPKLSTTPVKEDPFPFE